MVTSKFPKKIDISDKPRPGEQPNISSQSRPAKIDEDVRRTYYLEPADDVPFDEEEDDEFLYDEVPTEEYEDYGHEDEEESLEAIVRNIHDKTYFGGANTSTPYFI